MLGGLTPLQAWEQDPTALRRIDATHLRHLLLAGEDRIVQKDGVRHNGLSYVAPELHGRGGQVVQVRYMPHDDRQVDVFLDGVHLCTAYPQGHLTPEKVAEFREHGKAETKRRQRLAVRRPQTRSRQAPPRGALQPSVPRDPAPRRTLSCPRGDT
jgi:putative transposase